MKMQKRIFFGLTVFVNSQTLVTSFKPFIAKTTRAQQPNQIQFNSSPACPTQAFVSMSRSIQPVHKVTNCIQTVLARGPPTTMPPNQPKYSLPSWTVFTFQDYLLSSFTWHHLLIQVWCVSHLESWPPGLLYLQGIVITIVTSGFYYIQNYKKRRRESAPSSRPSKACQSEPHPYILYCQNIK